MLTCQDAAAFDDVTFCKGEQGDALHAPTTLSAKEPDKMEAREHS
ncbi:MAG: hypothetical protein ACQEVT_08295 [Pseudomonadota bacterium]|nr:hypothetical protein [Roseovarius sp. EGI FJ00037]MCZ0812636.1 hypothetical protein [Roseovarius sp. EGI FJ00037]